MCVRAHERICESSKPESPLLPSTVLLLSLEALELWTMSLFRFEGALIGFGSLSSGAPVLAVQSFGRRGEFVNVREEARERRGWSLDLPSSFSSCMCLKKP